VGVPHHGRLARGTPAGSTPPRGVVRAAEAAAARALGAEDGPRADADRMRAVDGGARPGEGEAQQALARLGVVAVRGGAAVGLDGVVVHYDHVLLLLVVGVVPAAAAAGCLVPLRGRAPARAGAALQAQEARAQAEAPAAAPALGRRRRLRAGPGRPALQPLRRAEDAAVASGARGRQDAVQRVRRALQVRSPPPGVPPGLQPHLREQHPLQLPPQGAGNAPQEGGPPPRPGLHRAGRGLVLAGLASTSTPHRGPARDAVHFFRPCD
jgi:hypothetical protein